MLILLLCRCTIGILFSIIEQHRIVLTAVLLIIDPLSSGPDREPIILQVQRIIAAYYTSCFDMHKVDRKK